ncbi:MULTISPECIES: hypothetical protein [unclassified Marinovum]|uniref:hypothetical protein n=1 Tax=unclassified Marinovum TaxID=2647166 RepID=UPI003EDC8561
MSRPTLIKDRETECRVMALLQCTYAMIMETDRLASLIADLIGVEPSDEAITEAVYNAQNPHAAVMFLNGSLPHAGNSQ